MASNLEHLLRRIRDRVASDDEIEVARTLVADDDRLPDELRDIVLVDESEMSSDAAGLLSVLGHDDLGELLAEAVLAEAASSSPDPPELAVQEADPGWRHIARSLEAELRRIATSEEVVDGVMRRLPSLRGWVWGSVLADAVRAHAGHVDVAAQVMGSLTVDELRVPVDDAVRAEAGRVDVVRPVMTTLSLREAEIPVAEAVRAEAGVVSLADAVLEQVGATSSMPSALAPAAVDVIPANNNRFWGRVALAIAAALVATFIGSTWTGGGSVRESPMVFAHAEDVVIEDLRFGDGASGMLDASSEDGTLILWLDEEP